VMMLVFSKRCGRFAFTVDDVEEEDEDDEDDDDAEALNEEDEAAAAKAGERGTPRGDVEMARSHSLSSSE